MTHTLAEFNAMTLSRAQEVLRRACGTRSWAQRVAQRRPFESVDALLSAAHDVWSGASREAILEAFNHHPRIGASIEKLREKFAATANLSEGEQARVAEASEETLEALRNGNLRYETRYGHIFIVCASGKTAQEMLALLEARMQNQPDHELQIAAREQAKITEIRLRAMFSSDVA